MISIFFIYRNLYYNRVMLCLLEVFITIILTVTIVRVLESYV